MMLRTVTTTIGMGTRVARLALLMTATATAPSAARAQATLDTAAIMASARAEIHAANEAWLPGLKQHDAKAIAAAYADSGLFVDPRGVVTRGRAAVEQMYEARFPRMRAIVAGGIVQEGMAVVAADRIYEWGHGWLEMAGAAAGAPTVKSGGAYLTVWMKERDGHWHIVRNLSF